tara:strand:- start:201 stop:455 length:255 start_codon:yes stop_codon:yes gene_type:complete
MSRKINISKYENNTHYSVHVIDSFGTEHHLGYWSELDNSVMLVIEAKARVIWENEVEPKEDLMSKAIKECIEIDKKAGRLPSLD